MRVIKKIPVFLLMTILCIALMAMPVLAASSSQDGLEVTLTTDKESYSQSEKIVATLMVTNTNDFAASNVSLENVIPEGYALAEGSEATKQIESLGAGETVSLSVTFVPADSENSGAQSGTGSDSSTRVETGDNSNIALWAGLLVFAFCGLVVVIVLRKKIGKKLLSLFLCVATVGTVVIGMTVPVKAAESQKSSISLSEHITINNVSLNICATVKYDVIQKTDNETGKPTMPDNPSEADEYYFNHSEVIEVIDEKETLNNLSETEAIHIFEERGFNDYPVMCEYSTEGEYNDQAEAVDGSDTKHPMYETFYVSESGDVWTIYVINGDIFAYPASFNLESDLDEVVIISESESLTSYDNETNKFYVTIPNEAEIILKTVDRIDAETLNQLTSEEVSK